VRIDVAHAFPEHVAHVVGRGGSTRDAPGRDDALALFSCADNLRIGAALDAVMIAERLFPAA